MKFAIGMLIIVWIAALYGSQAEAPITKPLPPKDGCQWIYDKALSAAFVADRVGFGGGGWTEGQSSSAQISAMWSQLYLACRAQPRRQP